MISVLICATWWWWVYSNIDLLHNSQWITFPTPSCLILWLLLSSPCEFFIPVVTAGLYWSSNDIKPFKFSRTFLSILADLRRAVAWFQFFTWFLVSPVIFLCSSKLFPGLQQRFLFTHLFIPIYEMQTASFWVWNQVAESPVYGNNHFASRARITDIFSVKTFYLFHVSQFPPFCQDRVRSLNLFACEGIVLKSAVLFLFSWSIRFLLLDKAPTLVVSLTRSSLLTRPWLEIKIKKIRFVTE